MNRPHLDFALALHRELPADGDLVWSPYSVASGLGLAATGAHGPTRDELVRVLAPGAELAELGALLAESARLRDADVAVANTLWTRPGVELRDAYREAVPGWPGAALHTADFRAAPEGARAVINTDVEKTTRGLIKELLAPGTVTHDTAAVIVNALYLKIAWRFPFAEAATRPAAFHAPSGTREVPTMRQQERIGYAAGGGWRMATLPTAGEVVVDILLPDGDATPSPPALAELASASAPASVDLALPRFRIGSGTILNAPLGRLGVVTAFTRDADFSGITSTERIWIDKVVHKAVLRVDEQGFEGAAATALVMRTVSLGLDTPVPFHVDRPFHVVVRHARTGAVYFIARVVEPAGP